MKIVLLFGFLVFSIIIFVTVRSISINKRRYDIKITKLPKNVDPNNILKREIIKRYGSKCPCCGEDRLHNSILSPYRGFELSGSFGYISDNEDRWRAKIDGKNHPFRFWEKTYTWVRMKGKCYTCGAEWDLPAYPILDLGEDEVDNIWNRIAEKYDKEEK
jgi:hypothetical protein